MDELEKIGVMKDVVTASEEHIEKLRTSRNEPDWMLSTRETAFERFAEAQWPTTREEEWRRTDLSGFDFGDYSILDPYREQQGLSRQTDDPEVFLSSGKNYSGVVRFRGTECVGWELDKEWQNQGVVFAPLHSALGGSSEYLRALFLNAITRADNRLQTWHYSVWSHGVYLYVPSFVEISKPFLLDFEEEGDNRLSSPHVAVFLARGARAVVAQRINSRDHSELLCNAGIDIHVSESAGLSYYEIQNLDETAVYFSHGHASVHRDGALHHFDGSMGSKLVKTRFDCNLDGSGSEVLMDGIYFSAGEQHMDIRSVQRHNAPQANSRAFYKGAVKDRARTIFQGLIEVSPLAAKTDAYLTNKNLILNDGARADSIPSLKIDTNDVKCSHGSTTGKINEDELFYLMSRGLPKQEARRMLVEGYFEEVTQQAPEPVVDDIRSLIQERVSEKL